VLIPYNTDAPIYHRPIATIGLIVLNVMVFVPTSKMWEPPGAPAEWGDPEFFEQLENAEGVDFENLEIPADFEGSDELDGMDESLPIDPWILRYGDGLHPVQWVTSNFIHDGFLHLFANMFIIWGFGLVVEGKIGWWKFLAVYFGIGIAQCAFEQTLSCVIEPEMFGSYGASAIAYGLIAIALVWAPKNDMNCILFILIRPIMFDMSVMWLAAVSICFEVLLAIFMGRGFTSEVLHLMGAGFGLIIGVGMLKLGWVDCEHWDIFSVLTQKTAFGAYERYHEDAGDQREVLDERDLAAERARTLDQIRKLSVEGQPAVAYAAYQKMQRDDPKWTMPDPDFLRLIEAYHKKKMFSESVPVIVDYLRRGQSAINVLRLRLAEILIRIEDRPGQALVVLSKLSVATLNDKQKQSFARLKQQAEKMKAAGSFETAAEDW
jgi:membrane associated rhomboid family serine protease